MHEGHACQVVITGIPLGGACGGYVRMALSGFPPILGVPYQTVVLGVIPEHTTTSRAARSANGINFRLLRHLEMLCALILTRMLEESELGQSSMHRDKQPKSDKKH